MALVPLARIAMARSGDKGEGSNVGVIARSEPAYRFLKRELSGERVRQHIRALERWWPSEQVPELIRIPAALLPDVLGLLQVRRPEPLHLHSGKQ